jgi:hypothetical protein
VTTSYCITDDLFGPSFGYLSCRSDMLSFLSDAVCY